MRYCIHCDEAYGEDTAVPASDTPGVCASCAEALLISSGKHPTIAPNGEPWGDVAYA